MATTNHLGITKIEQSQSQKEVTMNAALDIIDALLNTAIVDRDLTTPPGSPTEGALYIPLATATDDWVGQEGKIAHYTGGAWQFITPSEGLTLWVADEDALIVYNGSAWVGTAVQNAALMGINTTADATNKLAVASAAILFNHIGANCQVKVNKNAEADTGSFIFQTNFAGFAEFGLTGDNDFHFKVSPDNFSNTYEAFIIDKDTGRLKMGDSFFNIATAAEVTIASGVATVTKTHHKIDTESDAATDDLVTINGGAEGDVIILEAADDARTVVLKHATGNIRNFSGADISLDSYGKAIKYFYDGSNWLQI